MLNAMPSKGWRMMGLLPILALLCHNQIVQAGTDSCSSWTHWRGGGMQQGATVCTLPDSLKVAWEFTGDDAFSGSAVIADGVVYIGSEGGTLYALRLGSGNVLWKFEEPEMIQSTPTVCGGKVYVGDDSGTLYAVDRKTGQRSWVFDAKGEIISAVTCAGDRLVFGSYDGYVYCLTRDGELAWKLETGGRVHGTPAVFDEKVFAAGCDEFLHLIALSSGSSVAKVPMGSVSGASVAIRNDRAFVGTYGNQVLGVGLKDQKVAWRFEDEERQFPFMSSPAVAEDVLVIGGRDKYVRALDAATGKVRWAVRTKGRVDGSPIIMKDRVIVGSGDGVLYVFNLADGKEIWRFDTG